MREEDKELLCKDCQKRFERHVVTYGDKLDRSYAYLAELERLAKKIKSALEEKFYKDFKY